MELTVSLFHDIHRGIMMLASVKAEALNWVSNGLLSILEHRRLAYEKGEQADTVDLPSGHR